jgi:hypothetical protein
MMAAAAAGSSSLEREAGGNPLAALLAKIDFSEPTSFDGEEKTEYDPLRDGPLRYLGYANELGEAFAAWLFAGGVPLSYAGEAATMPALLSTTEIAPLRASCADS